VLRVKCLGLEAETPECRAFGRKSAASRRMALGIRAELALAKGDTAGSLALLERIRVEEPIDYLSAASSGGSVSLAVSRTLAPEPPRGLRWPKRGRATRLRHTPRSSP